MKITYENGEIVIWVPCTKEIAKAARISKTGRSRVITTTGGFTPVAGAPNGVKVGLNVIAKL